MSMEEVIMGAYEHALDTNRGKMKRSGQAISHLSPLSAPFGLVH